VKINRNIFVKNGLKAMSVSTVKNTRDPLGNARAGSNPVGGGVNTLSISQLQRLFSACHCDRAVKVVDLKSKGRWFDTQRPRFLFFIYFEART
jgi:hypothetical protein